jgi:hypothetical protein
MKPHFRLISEKKFDSKATISVVAKTRITDADAEQKNQPIRI